LTFQIGLEFDRAINWKARLGQEIPFLSSWLRSWNALRVADMACGSGKHAAALARLGFRVTGLDSSVEMLDAARYETQGLACRLLQHDMRIPLQDLQPQDALLCLGNSLALLSDEEEVLSALKSFRALVRAGGGFILHLLNFERFRRPERGFFPLTTTWEEGAATAHHLKYIELHSDHACVHLIRIHRPQPERWIREVKSDRLLPLRAEELLPLLRSAGFAEIEVFGDLRGSSYLRSESHDLVLCGRVPN